MTDDAEIPADESIPPFRGPYPGLQPFFLEDAPRFFGRGKQINAMLERLEDRRFLAVVGASGCGKSSLVYAGLLPALKKGYLMDAMPQWSMVTLRPGNSPLQNLARALDSSLGHISTTETAAPVESATMNTLTGGRFGLIEAITEARVPNDTNVLVLVDQFEEIFRYRDQRDESSVTDESAAQSEYERQNESIAFVNLLLTAATDSQRPIYVILTMRSDYLGDCDQFQGLPETINQSQFLTPRMTRDQLREAIVGPLRLFRAEADPGLVDQILNEIGTDPDQLPLMQHALMRTWSVACNPPDALQENHIRITTDHYLDKRVGGKQKALHLHAEETFAELGKHVAKNEKADSQPKWLQSYMTHASDSVLRLGHEVARQRRQRTPEAKNQIVRLYFRFYLRAMGLAISSVTFLFSVLYLLPSLYRFFFRDRSRPAVNRQQQICERMFRCLSDRNAKEKIVRRLARIQEIADVAGAPIDAVITVAKPFLDQERSFLTADPPTSLGPATTLDVSHEALLRQWDRAKEWIQIEQRSAETYRRLIKTVEKKEAGEAGYLHPPELTVVEQWDDEQAPNAVWASRYGSELSKIDDFLFWSRLWEFGRQVGMMAVLWGAFGVAYYSWNLWNKAEKAERDAQHNLAVNDLTNAGFAVRDHRIADALHWYGRVSEHAPDNDWTLTSSRNLLGGWSQSLHSTLVHDGSVVAVAFSPDGSTVLTGSEDNTARLWDARTGQARGEPLKHEGRVSSVAFSPDGSTVLTGSDDKTARLWDARTGQARGEPLKHDGGVLDVAFSPDGSTVLTGSYDNTARLWDARAGRTAEA